MPMCKFYASKSKKYVQAYQVAQARKHADAEKLAEIWNILNDSAK